MINLLLTEPTGGTGSLMMIAVLAGLMVLMFVFQSKSSKKRKAKMEEMIEALAVGSKVKTIGGIYGTIVVVDSFSFVIQTGNEEYVSFLKIDKSAVYSTDDQTAKTADVYEEAEETIVVDDSKSE